MQPEDAILERDSSNDNKLVSIQAILIPVELIKENKAETGAAA